MIHLVQVDALKLDAFRANYVKLEVENEGLKEANRTFRVGADIAHGEIAVLEADIELFKKGNRKLAEENDLLLTSDVKKKRFQALKIQRLVKENRELRTYNGFLETPDFKRAIEQEETIDRLSAENKELTSDVVIHLTARLDAQRELNFFKLVHDFGDNPVAVLTKAVKEQEETVRVLRIMNTDQERVIKGFEKGRDNLIQIIEGT